MVAARAMAIPANKKISTPGGLTAFGTNSGRIGLVKACWGAANGVLRWIGKHARVQWGSHAESMGGRGGERGSWQDFGGVVAVCELLRYVCLERMVGGERRPAGASAADQGVRPT